MTKSALEFLNANGYCVFENLFDEKLINKIKNKINYIFKENVFLGPVVNVENLSQLELKTSGANRVNAIKTNSNFYVDKNTISKGLSYYRDLTSGRSVEEPLINIPEIFELITSEKVLRVARECLGEKKIKIGYVKVRIFFANNVSNFDTNYFHADDNCEKIIKGIVYLNDVYCDDDGPFVYIAGSNKNKMLNKEGSISEEYFKDVKYSQEEIKNYYTIEKIKSLYGKRGTLALADTTGIHRGIKPISNDRYVLFVNYVCEEEYGGSGKKLKINSNLFKKCEEKKDLFEYFEFC